MEDFEAIRLARRSLAHVRQGIEARGASIDVVGAAIERSAEQWQEDAERLVQQVIDGGHAEALAIRLEAFGISGPRRAYEGAMSAAAEQVALRRAVLEAGSNHSALARETRILEDWVSKTGRDLLTFQRTTMPALTRETCPLAILASARRAGPEPETHFRRLTGQGRALQA